MIKKVYITPVMKEYDIDPIEVICTSPASPQYGPNSDKIDFNPSVEEEDEEIAPIPGL